jgi:hypothetical protein
MADRMTNVEIEDLLSSIRRLVSEEARPPLMRQPPRLVLTPASRIDRPAGAPDAPQPDSLSGHGRTPPPAPPAEDALEQRISELEAMLGLAPAFEPEEGDPFPDPPAAAPRPAPDGPPPGVAPDRPAGPKAAAAAEVLPLATPQPGEPPPDGPHRNGPWPDAPGSAGRPAAQATAPGPDTADAWEDAPPAPARDPGADGEVIDEAVLREMVRDILREELQGPLGERITLNIRKLVRAEIARALAAREL